MILYQEYPFMHVEHVLFNKFMRICIPYWEKIKRVTARNDCFVTYENKKQKLKNLLRGVHKVNIIPDLWTSCQRILYIIVICYFIDVEWRLNRHVLNFCNFSPPHSSFYILYTYQNVFTSGVLRIRLRRSLLITQKPMT